MSISRPNLSDEKRTYIKFMYVHLKWDADQIRKHPSVAPIQKRTVVYWIERIEQTGSVDRIKQKGAKRILNRNQESELVKYVERNNQKSYAQVKIDTKINCTPRTVNNYALRNGISKL